MAMGQSKGCHAMGIRGVTAGFPTGMPVRRSHRQTPDKCSPLPFFPLAVFILAFLHMEVFREKDQREFPPCKMSHPFSSPKVVKVAEFWSCLMERMLDRKSPRVDSCSQLCCWLSGSSTSTSILFYFFFCRHPRPCLLWCVWSGSSAEQGLPLTACVTPGTTGIQSPAEALRHDSNTNNK